MSTATPPSTATSDGTASQQGGSPLQSGTGPRQCDTRTLFGGARELLIEHDGAVYTLRITQHNRLILTK